MIQRKRGLFLVGLLAALAAVVILFPARVAYRMASPPLVALSGLSGTIWHGSAREFSTNGIYLRDLEWRIKPAGLLTGKAVYSVSGSPVSGFFDSEIAIGLGGTLALSNLTASLPLQMLAKPAGVAGLRGNLSVQIDRLELVAGRPAALDGTADIAGLVVPMVSRTSLGGYHAEFFTQNNGIVASIEDTDGVVDLAGSLQLNQDKSYSFVGQVVAKADTPASLKQRMQVLPRTDRPGQHELRLDGSY
ncbi:MAG: type II secretion system protein N [Woeseiaceae bacterium]